MAFPFASACVWNSLLSLSFQTYFTFYVWSEAKSSCVYTKFYYWEVMTHTGLTAGHRWLMIGAHRVVEPWWFLCLALQTWNKTVYRCTMFSATNDAMLVSLSGRCKFLLIPLRVTHFSPQHSQSTSRWLILLFCLQLSSAHKKLLTLTFSRWTGSRHQGTGSIDEEPMWPWQSHSHKILSSPSRYHSSR